jgi:hypothetical protein
MDKNPENGKTASDESLKEHKSHIVINRIDSISILFNRNIFESAIKSLIFVVSTLDGRRLDSWHIQM